jgi:hypothetical protein
LAFLVLFEIAKNGLAKVIVIADIMNPKKEEFISLNISIN